MTLMKKVDLVDRIEKLECALREMAVMNDGTKNIGKSRTCGVVNRIAKEALK